MLRFAGIFVLLFVLFLGVALSGQDAKTSEAKVQTIALPEIEALKYQIAYRDLVIEQQKYDTMFQKFLALTEVRTVLDKMNEMQKSLVEIEKKVLDERKLSRSDFFLDFQAGEIKPVPKKAVGATSAPQSPPPEEKK